MTPQEQAVVRLRLEVVFAQYAQHHAGEVMTLAEQNAQGKLYEMSVLSRILRCLRQVEGCDFTLMGGPILRLKSKPSKIDRNGSFFQINRNGVLIGELFTNLEFLTYSFVRRAAGVNPVPIPSHSDFHEMDIAIVQPGLVHDTRPLYEHVYLAAECKDTPMTKEFIRNMLGLRRELSLFTGDAVFQNIHFITWPRRFYSNDPSSALLLFCRDPSIRNYDSMSATFDIDLCYWRI